MKHEWMNQLYKRVIDIGFKYGAVAHTAEEKNNQQIEIKFSTGYYDARGRVVPEKIESEFSLVLDYRHGDEQIVEMVINGVMTSRRYDTWALHSYRDLLQQTGNPEALKIYDRMFHMLTFIDSKL